MGSYAYGFLSGDEGEEAGSFSGPLRWLDFGSGQERGMRASQREKLQARQQQAQQAQQQEQPADPVDVK